ncbi:CynX/NimT family MFS transporter [Sedimenticola hydrogenitrophicus]|uniref:MFS transporter n=1 Tax=Sedimenticola hydrogenitrophicus TaxID=2967975 RepID=UPI0021A545BB|nr:MFS transporter [Sedimenticola hydrogenitrophicus]
MQPPSKTNWGAVLIALTAGIIAAAHYGKAPSALPEIRAQIPISLIVGGWIMSVFSLTGMAFGIAAGTFADRLGARRMAMLGLGTLGLGSLVGGLAGSGEMLLLSRVIEGFGFIAVAVSAPVLIMRATALKDLQLALGIWTTYMPAGMALAMIFTPLLVTLMGWRAIWLLIALVSLLWLLLVWLKEGSGKRAGTAAAPPEHGLLENIQLTLRAPGPWLLSLGFGFYTLQWISLMAWLPSFLVEERGLSLEMTGLLTALVVAANIPGNLAVGWLLRWGVPRWSALLISGLGLGLTALGLFNDGFADTTRFLLCLAFSFFGGMTPGAALSGAPAVAPTRGQIGTVNGMLVQGSHLGQLLGPPALAALATYAGGWQETRWLMLAGAAGIVFMALLFRRLGISEATAHRRVGPTEAEPDT